MIGKADRSSCLAPLERGIAVLAVALILCLQFKAEPWLLVCLAIMLFGFVIVFGFVYLMFAFKSPDALRSESYSIQKMAIERGLTGDNVLGVSEHSTDEILAIPIAKDGNNEP